MNIITDHLIDCRRRNLADSTIHRRRRCVELFAAWLRPRPLTDARTIDIEVFLDARRLSPRTRRQWLSHLHCFFAWCIAAGHVDIDPTGQIIRPRVDRLLPRPIPDDDLAHAIRQAPRVMRIWLLLAAYAGLRVSEIAGLTRADVLDADQHLRVFGKGRKERIVPMHPQIHAALRGFGMPRTGPLFTRPNGSPYHPGTVSREISVYLDSVGVDATAHQLRHWFGTKTYRQCRDIRTVQELMGHASPIVTAGYAAAAPENARMAVDALAV